MDNRETNTFTDNQFLAFTAIFTRCLLFVAIATLAGCSPPDDLHKPVVLTGTIQAESVDKLFLYAQKGVLGNTLIDSTLVESGTFSFSVEIADEGYFIVQSRALPNGGSEVYAPLYLIQGDSLKINFVQEGVVYEGPSAKLQNYNSESWDFIAADSLYKVAYQPRYELPKRSLPEATSIIEEIREKRLSFFDEYFKDEPVPEKFKAVETAHIEYDVARKYYWFLRYHKNMTGEEGYDYLSVDSSFYGFLERIDLKNEINPLTIYPWLLADVLNDKFFRHSGFYGGDAGKEYLLSTNKSETQFKTQWIHDNLDGASKDLGFYSLLSSARFRNAMLDSLDVFFEDLKPIHAYLKNDFTDSTLARMGLEICEDFLRVAPGAIPPPLAFPDTSGNEKTLDSFLGKIVYIDFWGTWCGPCIAAIPDHLALQKKFVGQDVAFVNIALEHGEDYTRDWKRFLQENDFPGTHLVAENSFNNEQIQSFMITRAPSYVLIDKEGKMVTSAAPKPAFAEAAIAELLHGSDD